MYVLLNIEYIDLVICQQRTQYGRRARGMKSVQSLAFLPWSVEGSWIFLALPRSVAGCAIPFLKIQMIFDHNKKFNFVKL